MICYGCGGMIRTFDEVAWDRYGTSLHSACLVELEEEWDRHDLYARNLSETLAKERAERAAR